MTMERFHPDDLRIIVAALMWRSERADVSMEKADELIQEARKDEIRRDAARRQEQAMRGSCSVGSWVNGLGQQWNGR